MNENVHIMWAQLHVLSNFSLIKHAHIYTFLLLSIYFSDKKEIFAGQEIIYINLDIRDMIKSSIWHELYCEYQ